MVNGSWEPGRPGRPPSTNLDPKYGTCRTCRKQIQWRHIGYKRDGSPRWHPFDCRLDALSGAFVGTETSHFDTCPNADEFRPKKPVHEHEYRRVAKYDLIAGAQRFDECACGETREATPSA